MDALPIGSSSMLRGAAYDPDTEELRITFANGATYAYAGVPQSEVDSFVGAESHGKYFLSDIKEAYQARRV